MGFTLLGRFGDTVAVQLSRTYPTGFAKRLFDAYASSSSEPFRADLRRKYQLPVGSDDVEIFMNYPCNRDQWDDANIGEVFDYIWSCKSLVIPDEWLHAMNSFKREYDDVRENVSCWHVLQDFIS